MYREKILADELAENNDAIDAFQLYADTISIGRSEFNVLNSDGFYDALAYFLATLPTEKEIVMKAWEEYAGECYHSGCNDYSESFPDWWLDQEQENES